MSDYLKTFKKKLVEIEIAKWNLSRKECELTSLESRAISLLSGGMTPEEVTWQLEDDGYGQVEIQALLPFIQDNVGWEEEVFQEMIECTYGLKESTSTVAACDTSGKVNDFELPQLPAQLPTPIDSDIDMILAPDSVDK